MAHSSGVLVLWSHAIGRSIVLRRRFPRALQWHVRTTTTGGLMVIPAGRNTWMMEMPVVDSWSSVVSTLRWKRWLLRRNIRRWNTG